MLILKAFLLSGLALYIYLFCTIRLINYEFRSFITFLRGLDNPWLLYLGVFVFAVFSPIVFVLTVITKVLWKVTNFLLK